MVEFMMEWVVGLMVEVQVMIEWVEVPVKITVGGGAG